MGRPSLLRRAPRRLWRILRRLLQGLFLLALLLVATLFLLRRPSGLEFLRKQVLSRTRDVLPGLSLERIEGDLTSTLTLRGVVLNDRFGGPALRVRRIGLRYDLTRLASGVIRVDELELDQPELWVQPSRSGALNLSQLVVVQPTDEKPASEPTSLRLELERLQIHGARIKVAAQRPTLAVDSLELDLGLRGSVRDATLDLRRLLAIVELPDGKRARASLSGRVSLDHRRLEADLAARATGLTRLGELSLELRARGPHSHVELGSRLSAAGRGVVTLEGWAGIDQTGRPSYAFKSRLTGINPDELVPALRPTRLGLELEVKGAGVPLRPGSSLRLALRMPPAILRGLRVEGLALEAATQDGRWTLRELKVRAADGRVSLWGEGTLERVDATAEIDLPRLDRLPAPIRALGVPKLGGSVRLSARVSGPVQGPLSVRSTLRLQRVQLAALRLDRADLSASLDGLPAAPAGGLHLSLSGLRPGDPQLRMDRGRLEVKGNPRSLQIVAEADGPSLRVRVAADTKIAAGGRQLEARLRQLELQGLGQRVLLRNEPKLFYSPSRIEADSTRLALLGGEVTAAGVLRPNGFPRLLASLRVDGVRPPGFPYAIDASVEVRADRAEARADLQAKLASLGTSLAFAARLPVRYRGPMPALARERDGELRVTAKGIRLGLLHELRPELPAVAGDASLQLDLKGPLVDPALHLGLELSGAGLGDIRGIDAVTQVDASNGRTALRQRVSLSGQALLTLDSAVPLSLGTLLQGSASLEPYRELPLDLHLKVHPTRLASLPRLDPLLQRLAGVISADLEVTGSPVRPRVALETRLEGSALDGLKLRDLAAQIQLTAGDKDLRVSLDASRDRQPLIAVQSSLGLRLEELLRSPAARAELVTRAPLDLVLRLPSYPLDRLAALGGGLEGLRGRISGSIHVWGATRAPHARADLQLAELGYSQVDVGALKLGATFNGRELQASLDLRQPAGGKLRSEARLPLVAGQGLEARVRGEQLDLSFLSGLSPAVREAAGKLCVDLKAAGSLRRPVLTGQVTLAQGRLHLRGVSPLHHLNARVDLEPERIRLSRFDLQADQGRLEASGQLDLSGRGLDLARGPELLRGATLVAKADGLGLDAGGVTGVVFSGGVRVDARREGATLATRVSIEDGVVKMPKLEGKQTHSTSLPPDVVFLDGPKTRVVASGSAAPLGLRLDLAADPLFVRSEELDLELANDVHLRTDRRGRPRVAGKVEIRRGRIRALNNTFEVRRATVSLSGEVDPDPALDILLERAAPEALVLVQITGTARAPELSLRSDPPAYDQSQIISLLLTGRVDSRPDSGGGDQTVAIASALSQVLLGSVLQCVAPKVGIDVARVSFDESKDQKTGESQLRAEAEVGKYLTERLYIGYRRVFGASALENTNEGMMEYRISARWLLMALFGDAGVGGLDLLWNFRH